MNVLLIRLRLIGDVVFTTPVIAAVRRAYPRARLTYLVEAAAAPVVAANPHLTEVIVVPHSRGWQRMRDDLHLGWRLRSRRFDLVVDLHGGPRSAWLTWASGAPVRVGYDVPGRSWMYTRVVARPRGYRPRHAVSNQWDLLTAIDPSCAAASPEHHPVEMGADAAAIQSCHEKLDALGIRRDASIVVMHVSAGNPFRRWPEGNFVELAARLATADDNRWVLLTAGPSDRDAAARILQGARTSAGRAAARVVAADHLTLGELRAALDRAALFVGGDSGPMHIAATSGVPIVSIYGPTLAERSAPWRPARFPTRSIEPRALPCRPCDQRVCAPGDFRCLSMVTEAAVRSAAEELLGGRP